MTRDPSEGAGLGQESLEELYDDAPCGYLSSTPDGTIVRVNKTFLRWTGFEERDLVGGRRLQDLLTAGGRIYHETHVRPLLRMQGSIREIALDIECADGRTLPVLMNSVLRTDETGEPALVRTVVFDATERRGYERELLRARSEAERSEARARELARTLQASLIPPAPPAIPGIEIAAEYRPGTGHEVGGDFYDVFALAEGRTGLVIGDVQGKGPEAATVTALTRYTVRAAAVQDPHPSVVLSTLHRALLIDPIDRFATAIYVLLEGGGPHAPVRVTMGSAGHPMPIVARADGSATQVGSPGMLLGAFEEEIGVEATTITLERDGLLVLFTDGVTEARTGGDLYGEERLISFVAEHRQEPCATLAKGIAEEALSFQSGSPRDDIAVIVLRPA